MRSGDVELLHQDDRSDLRRGEMQFDEVEHSPAQQNRVRRSLLEMRGAALDQAGDDQTGNRFGHGRETMVSCRPGASPETLLITSATSLVDGSSALSTVPCRFRPPESLSTASRGRMTENGRSPAHPRRERLGQVENADVALVHPDCSSGTVAFERPFDKQLDQVLVETACHDGPSIAAILLRR